MAPVMPHKDSRNRAEAALKLRAKRMTWAAISTELGFSSRQGARLAVERLLGRRSSNPMARSIERELSAESLRTQEECLQPLLDDAVDRADAETAVMLSRELRSLVADRAKLTGIAAPQRVEVGVNVTTTTEIIANARRQLLAIDNTIDAEVIE